MFSFGQKYYISVQTMYDYKENKVSYIKEINDKTHTYIVTSSRQQAKAFKFSKANELVVELRKKNKGISFRVC